jgi:iodotyrosine deiodinase
MYRKGEVTYQALPLPDRVQMEDEAALAAAERFLAYMRKRHSVRDYSPRPVPEAVITACIAAAGTAPSGANHQPWHFVAISDPAMKARIREGAEEEERAFYSGGGGMNGSPRWSPSGPGCQSRI